MSEIFVGRQPIYNHELDIYAYELMPRSSQFQKDEEIDNSDEVSSRVIINAFLDIGIDKIVGKDLAFIRLSEHFLRSDEPLPLPTDKLVVKIPTTISVDDEVIAGMQKLSDSGFKIAIDNYLIHTHLQPLANMASMIDMNVQQVDEDQLKAHIQMLKKLHPLVLADHVESYEQYEFCRSCGVDYIQGYFLNRPRVISGESLAANQITVMNLLATLHNPDTDVDEIDEVITKDVSLSYKILKLINSAFFSRATDIESIRHAIVMLGRKQLCTWASMMALSSMDDKPKEQVRIAMIRAKSCELLAQKADRKNLDSFFTVGMFSALDLLMDRSLEELLGALPLADNVTAALLNREGELGEALNCTLAQESADWLNIRFADLNNDQLSDTNIEAINWADEVLNAI